MKLTHACIWTLALGVLLGSACSRTKTPAPVRQNPVALEDEKFSPSPMTVDEFSRAILNDIPLEKMKPRLGVPFSTPEQDMYILKDGKAIITARHISVQHSGQEEELILRQVGPVRTDLDKSAPDQSVSK